MRHQFFLLCTPTLRFVIYIYLLSDYFLPNYFHTYLSFTHTNPSYFSNYCYIYVNASLFLFYPSLDICVSITLETRLFIFYAIYSGTYFSMSLQNLIALFDFYVAEYSRIGAEASLHRLSGNHGNALLMTLCRLTCFYSLSSL